MTRRELLSLLAAPLIAQAQGETPARCIVIVRDVSPSYKNSPAIGDKLLEVVRELGPGDEMTLIELGGPFSPEACVKVQCRMPGVPPPILAPVKKLDDWRKNQSRLDAVWRRVQASQRSVESYLRIPPPVKDPTPLFETLAYCATIMKTPGGANKKLLVFSDLVQDSKRARSLMPPTEIMEFTGVFGFALFVPWQGGFSERAAAWRRWFIASGGIDFEMLDGAQSRVRRVLDRNAAPRILPQRF